MRFAVLAPNLEQIGEIGRKLVRRRTESGEPLKFFTNTRS